MKEFIKSLGADGSLFLCQWIMEGNELMSRDVLHVSIKRKVKI